MLNYEGFTWVEDILVPNEYYLLLSQIHERLDYNTKMVMKNQFSKLWKWYTIEQVINTSKTDFDHLLDIEACLRRYNSNDIPLTKIQESIDELVKIRQTLATAILTLEEINKYLYEDAKIEMMVIIAAPPIVVLFLCYLL